MASKGRKGGAKEEAKEEIPIIQQYANIWGQDEADAIIEVLEGTNSGGQLVEGPQCKEFEKQFAEFVGAKYCVLMPNPTLALYATLAILRPKFRTTSLRIPDFGYMEIFNACIMASMSPVLADVTDTGVLELRDQEAGIAVHYNGRKAKPTLLEICFDAIDVHTKGLLSVYDFNYQRHLSLGGKGGAVCTDNPDEYNVLLRLKDQGRLQENSQDFDYWGTDLQVTEFQAAYGLAQLKHLQKKVNTVKGFYNKIRNAFTDTDKIVFLSESPSMYFDVYTREPTKLGQFLAENGIMANRLPKPLHTNKIAANAQRVDTTFTFSDTLYNAGIFLPSSPIMEEKQVDRIIEVLRKFVELE